MLRPVVRKAQNAERRDRIVADNGASLPRTKARDLVECPCRGIGERAVKRAVIKAVDQAEMKHSLPKLRKRHIASASEGVSVEATDLTRTMCL